MAFKMKGHELPGPNQRKATKTAKKADIKVNETKKAPVAEPTVDVSKDDSKSDAAGAMKMIKKNK